MSRLAQAAPARKEAIPAKVALSGPAGGGKTFTALHAARVFAGPDGKILLLDTERRSASLYADLVEFDTIDWLPPYDPRELAQVVVEAAGKYAVVVIDSLSHFWFAEGGTLDIVDDAALKARGNSYAGWKEGTPAQEGMYEAILACRAHVICCIRSKMEYVLEVNSRGKQEPKKVGMAPVQRDGVEYQFTVQLELDVDHNAIVGKTRCPLLSGRVYGQGETEAWAATLLGWLNDGEAAPAVACPVCEGFTGRNKIEVAAHLVVLHGWSKDESGKVHPPTATQQGRSDDDATAEGDAARPGASAATVSPAKTGDREASEQSPTMERAEAGEGLEAGASPRSARPPSSDAGSTAQAPQPPADDEGSSPSAGVGSSPSGVPAGDPGGESGGADSAPGSPPPMTDAQRRKLMPLVKEKGLVDKEDRLTWASMEVKRHLASFSDLSQDEASHLIEAADLLPVAPTLEGVS